MWFPGLKGGYHKDASIRQKDTLFLTPVNEPQSLLKENFILAPEKQIWEAGGVLQESFDCFVHLD